MFINDYVDFYPFAEWIWAGVGVLTLLVSLWAIGHVVLFKRDPRSALYWIAIIILSPLVGVLFYLVFGINRVARQGKKLNIRHKTLQFPLEPREPASSEKEWFIFGDQLTDVTPSSEVRVEVFNDGTKLFTEMLEAIRGAQHSVYLETYIFNTDDWGEQFVAELSAAEARGVQVRVLIDGVGGMYSFPWLAVSELKKAGVRAEKFLPTRSPWRAHFLNLRLHRKLLIIDQEVAFTGGVNITGLQSQSTAPPGQAIDDLHFRLEGGVVKTLVDVFCLDWAFTSGEELAIRSVEYRPRRGHKVEARAIMDGPDDDVYQIHDILMGAISLSKKSVTIFSPYFLPDAPLQHALKTASLRGVRVEIFTPEKNDLPWIKWAAQAQVSELLMYGCKFRYVQGRFDHSKLTIVDEKWVFFGSANWDVRSFRLNFELNVECMGGSFVEELQTMVSDKRLKSRDFSISELEQRPILIKLRDGIARLFSPFL